MSRPKPPFNADAVGSLLRPPAILEARARRNRGDISSEILWAIESGAVEDAVALQKAAGLKVCSDGEFHRRHWFLDFLEKIDGVKTSGGRPQAPYRGSGQGGSPWIGWP
jgi:5-methyltetrahydropteroyltriglutamate--homocysteine methyltransferase